MDIDLPLPAMPDVAGSIIDLPRLRERAPVFRNRAHAGEVLAQMLEGTEFREPVLLAVPAGGVPVARAIAERLGWPLDVAVVSKITLPWNTEAGYGAVAFDGTLRLNEAMIDRAGLRDEEVQAGIERTRCKVASRVRQLRGGCAPLDLRRHAAILVDDGLASGFTMRVGIEAVRKLEPDSITLAIPTGPAHTVTYLARQVQALYCANVRSGPSFAVADAYERWHDVDEAQAARALGRLPH